MALHDRPTGSHYAAQAGLKLIFVAQAGLELAMIPCLSFPSAGITGMRHHARLLLSFFFFF